MMNKEMAKAFTLLAEGFNALALACENIGNPLPEAVKVVENVVSMPTVQEVKEKVVEPVKEVTPEAKPVVESEHDKEEIKVEAEPITEASLNALSYNDLKAKAKKLGVKAVGSKKAIIENILASLNNEEVAPVEEPTTVVEEVTEVTEDFTPEEVENSLEDAVIESEDTGIEVEADEDEIEEDTPTLYDEVARDLEGYTDEELADILSDIGVSPKGRRQALLAKIVQAIEDGQLEWEESDESTTTPEPQVEEEEIEDEADALEGYTEARKHACYEICDKIEEDVERGNLSHKEIIKFLKDYNNGRYVSQGLEADLDEYLAIQCDLVDDEGEHHSMSDPYFIGDDVYCCGAKVKELNGDLYCEKCGVTYENE